METIMMLGASERHVPFIEKAVRNGYFVVCLDQDPDAPGFEYATAKEIISIKDEDHYVLYTARKYKINACVSIPDIGLRSASYVNTLLGLKGLKYHTYNILSNKAIAKYIFSGVGVRTPLLYNGEYIDESDFPVVAKPVKSTGSQDVVKLTSLDMLIHFLSTCKYGSFIVEKYIEGDHVSVDIVMKDGKAQYWLMQDRYLTYEDCFVDGIIISPSKYYDHFWLKGALPKIAETACMAVGLTDGPANVQFIVDKGETPFLIEINPRVSGPYGIECHSLATHTCWFMDMVKIALGKRINNNSCIEPIKPNACITIGAEESGYIQGWTYPIEEFNAVYKWHWKYIDDYVNKFKVVKDSVKHICITGDDVEEVKERAFKIARESKVIIGGKDNGKES